MLFLDLIMSLPIFNASAGKQCTFTERLIHAVLNVWLLTVASRCCRWNLSRRV